MRQRFIPSGFITIVVLLSGCAGGTASPSSAAPDATLSPRATVSSPPSTSTTAGAMPSTTPASSSVDAETVLRQFLAALDSSDLTQAAALVAEGAMFFEEAGSPTDLVRSLVCTAEIVSADESGGRLDVELQFTGPTEWHSECADEGTTLPLAVTVEDGKIVDMRGR